MRKRKIKVVVLGRNANGEPSLHVCSVDVTDDEYAAGVHYERAIDDAAANGFESPFEAFDENDEAARQMFSVAIQLGGGLFEPAREQLETVIDMARSYIDYIETGIEEGIYDRAENADVSKKRQALDAVEVFCRRLSDKPQETRYLLIMVGDIEPELSGPYASAEDVLQAARNQRIDDPNMENGLFAVTVLGERVMVDSFSGAALNPTEETV